MGGLGMVFSKAEIRRIKSLTKAGKTQYQIARALHTRKQNVATYLRTASLGVRAPPTGAVAFWKDVKKVKELLGYEREEAIKVTKVAPKWLKKRVARLSVAEQKMHKEWARLTTEYRRAAFKKGGIPLSKRLLEDYEEYFTTP